MQQTTQLYSKYITAYISSVQITEAQYQNPEF